MTPEGSVYCQTMTPTLYISPASAAQLPCSDGPLDAVGQDSSRSVSPSSTASPTTSGEDDSVPSLTRESSPTASTRDEDSSDEDSKDAVVTSALIDRLVQKLLVRCLDIIDDVQLMF